MQFGDVRLDLGKVTIPIYELFTKEDHIAPASSVFRGSKLFGGPVRYAMAGSGHIAGVVNPPAKKKYQYWSGAPASSLQEWMATATETAGSWWPDWAAWLAAYSGEKVPARDPSTGPLKPIEDAPGSYVKSHVEPTTEVVPTTAGVQ
jgi:polyhydroxyalkanoate synthase